MTRVQPINARCGDPWRERLSVLAHLASLRIVASRAAHVGLAAVMVFSLSGSASTAASTLSNGDLAVTIRADSGAIGTLTFGGSDWFNPGTMVADFGFQEGLDPTTFSLNTTWGWAGQQVSLSGDASVSVSGTFDGIADVAFVRRYSLVEGHNVLEVTTEFTNLDALLPATLTYFDTFDPDQGIDQGNQFGTFNDVDTLNTGLGPALVGVASDRIGESSVAGLTMVLGSLDPRARVASGGPFQVDNSGQLAGLLLMPVDGEGTFDDMGTHVGLEVLLAPSASSSFTFHLAFGADPQAALDEFLAVHLPFGLLGDFDYDGDVDADDIDLLIGLIQQFDSEADLDGDGEVTHLDMDYMIAEILGTTYGDADLDGDVDGVDLDAWRLHPFAGWASGDFDCDGDVDGADFDIWRGRPQVYFGSQGSSLAPVPEPTTVSLALIATAALVASRIRRRFAAAPR